MDVGAAQHDIAAEFRINQGRVSEVKTGLRKSKRGKLNSASSSGHFPRAR